MKSEDNPTPTPQPASQPATPAATTAQMAYSSWATTPGSQYYPYASHYPQAAYASHYQAYAPPVAAASPATAAPTKAYTPATAPTTTTTGAANAGAIDTSDIATLNDALGSAGVDLRAEEESLQQPSSSSSLYHPRTYADRTRKAPSSGPSFSTLHLTPLIRSIATSHKVTNVLDESVVYLALALRARMEELLEGMVHAARHRTDVSFDRPARVYSDLETPSSNPNEGDDAQQKQIPIWHILIRSDVAKQLNALEKAEREDEMRVRKERKQRAEMQAAHAAALAAQASGSSNPNAAGGGGNEMDESPDGLSGVSSSAGGGGSGAPKKKRKKEGPGVTARNMSEDVRKKMSNAVASQAAGLGGRYAWMNAGAGGASKAATTAAGGGSTPAAGTTATAGTAASPTTTGAAAGAAATSASSSWARPYVPTQPKSSGSGSTGTTGTATSAGAGAIPGQVKVEDTTTTAGANVNLVSAHTTMQAPVRTLTLTMRDALFVVEKERGHGGGRGAAKGWV